MTVGVRQSLMLLSKLAYVLVFVYYIMSMCTGRTRIPTNMLMEVENDGLGMDIDLY